MNKRQVPERQAHAASGRVAQVAMSRRSFRGPFLPTAPDPATIDEILTAGLAAPSSKNAKPWRLHVVTDRQLLGEIALEVCAADGIDDYVPVDPLTGQPHEQYTSTVVESAEALAAAPLAIFIENRGEFSVGRQTLLSVPADHLRGALLGHGLEVLGIGGAILSMWLAASDLGLAGVFMGDVLIAEAMIAERLGMEGDPIGVLVLGRPVVDIPLDGSTPPDMGSVVRH